jgi:hypothetical protein
MEHPNMCYNYISFYYGPMCKHLPSLGQWSVLPLKHHLQVNLVIFYISTHFLYGLQQNLTAHDEDFANVHKMKQCGKCLQESNF